MAKAALALKKLGYSLVIKENKLSCKAKNLFLSYMKI
jgi:hypothetical protein